MTTKFFAEFELDPAKRLLYKAGERVNINSTALDVLIHLVQNSGELVLKDELLDSVWRDRFVEESNLKVQVSALRKLLGEGPDEHRFIATVPGKGYMFVAKVFDGRELNEEDLKSGLSKGHEDLRVLSSSETGTAASKVTRGPVPLRRDQSVISSWPIFAVISAVMITVALVWTGATFLSSQPSSANSDSMVVMRITNEGHYAGPAISPDGNFVAYSSNSYGGIGSLYVQQLDTNATLQLLEPAERNFGCLGFSPDGKELFLVMSDTADKDSSLYSMPVIGGPLKRLIKKVRWCFTISPDGSRIAFYRDIPDEKRKCIVTASIEGTDEREEFCGAYAEMQLGFFAAWSPDGTTLAFVGSQSSAKGTENQIFGLNIVSSQIRPLSSEGFTDIGKIEWTNDGRDILFVGKRPRGVNKLWVLNRESGTIGALTKDVTVYSNYGMSISKDDRRLVVNSFERQENLSIIDSSGDPLSLVGLKTGASNGRTGMTVLPDNGVVFTSHTANGVDIWRIDSSGTNATQLISDEFVDKDLASSPDGQHLIFVSDRNGGENLFRADTFNPGDHQQLTFNANWVGMPDVSPDGQTVVFAMAERADAEPSLWTVPVFGGELKRITDYRSISPVYSPDGKFIACILPSDSIEKRSTLAIISVDGGAPIASFDVLPFFHYPTQKIQWTPDGTGIVYGDHVSRAFNLFKLPLATGIPEQLTRFPTENVWNFEFTHDGRNLVIVHGRTISDIFLIKDFR